MGASEIDAVCGRFRGAGEVRGYPIARVDRGEAGGMAGTEDQPGENSGVIKLSEPQASLDFLGYTFRQHLDQYGRPLSYWNLEPSRKALEKEREAIRGLINPKQCHTPLPELIERVNRHRRGWANYFKLGYPRKAFRAMNRFVVERLTKHLHRRSQRGWRAREDVSAYAHLVRLGLVML